MCLASPNWLGIVAEIFVQPWAVCSQHTNNARLVSKGRHRARTKGSWNTLLEQRDFLEGLGPEREAGGFCADWTFRRCHLLQLRSDYLLGGLAKSVQILARRCAAPPVTLCGFMQLRLFLQSTTETVRQQSGQAGRQGKAGIDKIQLTAR